MSAHRTQTVFRSLRLGLAVSVGMAVLFASLPALDGGVTSWEAATVLAGGVAAALAKGLLFSA